MSVTPQFSEYVQQLDHVAQQQYVNKLKVREYHQLDGLPDPYALAKDFWSTDPSDWPDVQFGDIYNYLIFKTGNTALCYDVKEGKLQHAGNVAQTSELCHPKFYLYMYILTSF